jgi:LPXTG-motif cell wall-anchored protein
MQKVLRAAVAAGLLAGLTLTPGLPALGAKVPFTIDPEYAARFERDYTTQFPSRWTNQVRGTAWRTAHDAAAIYLREEWSRLLKPFAGEGAFSELRPFNFVDPLGTNPDNTDPVLGTGPENNVLAFMPGSDPVLRNQVVIIGGHYDCVDITVDGGLDCGMQMPATTAVLEGLVRYWLANDIRPRRSVAFFAIDGEEQCLCGSVHYTSVGSVNALLHHLEFPSALSVVAYHDTDMIGANYPNRMFGLSSSQFMPLFVNAAPALDEPDRALAPFAAYYPAVLNPAFLARFKLYRRASLRQRDRFFADMHAKYPTWTYRDGVTKPLFTEEQKKYITIIDDPLDRSDHTVFIVEGVPAEINIGLNDPTAAPPGWVPYHHVGETQEEVNLMRGGTMSLNRDSLLGYEATSMWVAYLAGAGEDSPANEPFFIGETTPASMPGIEGIRLDTDTAILPEMPRSDVAGTWRPAGLDGTIVRGLEVDPTDPRTIYAASQDRGFLVSRDAGATFAESNDGLGPYTSLWSVTADPAHANRLWASTHHGGVFRSDDGGRTWRVPRVAAARVFAADVAYTEPQMPVMSTQLLSDNIEIDQNAAARTGMWVYGYDLCLAQFAPEGQQCATRADWPSEGYDPHAPLYDLYRYASEVSVMSDGSVLGAGFSTYMTGGGVFRSVNAGATWDYRWADDVGSSNLWRIRRAGPSRAFASGSGGVFRSEDAGQTWTHTPLESSEVRALATDPTNPNVVYAGSWNASGGVFKSEDGGESWTASSSGIPERAGIAALAVDPGNAKRVAAATYWYGVYLSTDGGASWKLAADGMPLNVRQRLDDVDFGPAGVLYASSHDGIWRLGGSSVLPRKVTRPSPDVLPGTGIGTPTVGWAMLCAVLALGILLYRRRWRRAVR